MRLRIEVRLKPGHFDPEGDVAARSLRDLGFQVGSVKVGKVYFVELNCRSRDEALRLADEMCRKLLANPVKDDYSVEVLQD
ncbi:MAG: phosphoribosylformylglycinamidine synthase subunit PurS [Thermoproteota archaeon]